MQGEARKAAVTAYRERKVEMGVYVARCAASGQAWVGSAPDLATIWNRLSFTLRQGGNTHRTLQAAWTAHGAEAFSFEIVERMEVEEIALVRDRALKERRAHWAGVLGAEPI